MKKTINHREHESVKNPSRGMLYIGIGIAAIVIGLGIALRLVETLTGNYVFGFDQGLDFLAARSIAVDHKITLIGSEAGAGFAGLPGVFHGPGERYIHVGKPVRRYSVFGASQRYLVMGAISIIG